jgi:DNA-binding NarL/FixJ family response regulator
MTKTLNLAVVDDHTLYRRGLVNLIQSLGDLFVVQWEFANGKDFLDALQDNVRPDLVLLDIDMPVMNGFETAAFLKEHYPKLPILVVSMLDDEATLIRMLKLGVRGLLSKDVEPEELKMALQAISDKGFYYTDTLTGQLIHALNHPPLAAESLLNEREQEFIVLCCSELTYKEIADKMCLSPKTIDGYRAALFEKLEIKSRVGLVLYAIREGIFHVAQ